MDNKSAVSSKRIKNKISLVRQWSFQEYSIHAVNLRAFFSLLLFTGSCDINSLTRPSLSLPYFNELLCADHVRHGAYQQVTLNNVVEACVFKDTGNGIMFLRLQTDALPATKFSPCKLDCYS